MAKLRVAPVHMTTIPHLELLGAVLMIDFVNRLNSNLDNPFQEREIPAGLTQ